MKTKFPINLVHYRFQKVLRLRQLLVRGQSVLVAVSGGQDSLCLLRLLLDLQPAWEWQLAVAHCDHCWLGDQGIAEHVQKLADSWGVSFYLRTATVPPRNEAQARQWRYQMLAEMAQTTGSSAVVTAHTQSDRAETLLHNLIRGSGADGLQSLSWQRELVSGIDLVRPMLEISREETSAFCREQGLSVWNDVDNNNLAFSRNRIRQELLTYLKEHFNPQAETHIARTADLLQADVQELERAATELLARVTHPKKPWLNRVVLRREPLSLQRRVIRQFLKAYLSVSNSLAFDHVEKCVSLLRSPNRSSTDPFPGGQRAVVEHPWIWLTPNIEECKLVRAQGD